VAVKALMPEWVRWNCEQTGVPEHLIEQAVAVASGNLAEALDQPASEEPAGSRSV